ncbi:hypothetical protein KSP39_PZI020807 [Platanthera zijinensis]|uniref:C2H2-type domain-containing protein n=1 Tax=Platanthera zijinensis TaxID=2320716 RepID=A0AAP0FX82_9ASPA
MAERNFCLSLPPLAWSTTGRRGRTKPPRSPETAEHSAALFLLSLSYPHAASIHRRAFIGDSPPPPQAESDEARTIADQTRGGRSRECSVCPKRFRTGRALGGHMKSHLERDLKGRIVKTKMRKISSLGLELEFGFTTSPIPPPISGVVDAAAGSPGKGQSTPPASILPPF